jgi:glyoxylase-like metal-dependent hydrolase (beta-lactamase superfamily II)
MRTPILVCAMALMMAAGFVRAQQGTPPNPPPLVRENATEQLTPHVYWIPDGDTPQVPNVGIVVGSRATLVIDTGLGPRSGETIVREAAKVTRGGDQYLAMTHFHAEHDLGAQAFPSTTRVIRWRAQDQDIAELGLAFALNFATQNAFNAGLLKGTNFRKTDIAFDREHRLDVGGVHVRIVGEGPAHTRGDTIFFVEEDRVLFTGDIVMPAFPAFQPSASSVRTWSAVLDRLEAMKPAIIVPSHGRRGDASMIGTYREYFRALQARAMELKKQGRSSDEAAAVMQEEMPKRFPGLAYRGANRVTLAAQVAYREAP